MGVIETHERGDCDRYHDLVRDFGGRRPTITVLCGSTRFYQEFQRLNYERTMAGEIVLSVGFYPHAKDESGHGEGVGHNSREKERLDELHLRKIDVADKVLVINPGGYIGESTKREILYAYHLCKPVEWLEKTCDNSSVGAFVTDPDGKLLVIERADGMGIAPPAGHAREHGGLLSDAIATEITEETGLTVIGTPVGIGDLTAWRGNRCGRQHPGLQGVGHKWVYYTATAVGTPTPDPRETKRVWFAAPHELSALAARTVLYARGQRTAQEFADRPGIEPVWIRPLQQRGMLPGLRVTDKDLELIEHVAVTRGQVAG
jgi:8-oxo-dGTP pyrophosphatase MutT (NUDIX family)